MAAAAVPLHRLNVSATNWLPTGIQGAKEPLDEQSLEAHPAINALEPLRGNQPCLLGLAIKAREAMSVHLNIYYDFK